MIFQLKDYNLLKKNTALTAARCRENWPNQLVKNLRQKTSVLTAAGWRENSLKKVCFFTAIRQSYKTLVSKKNHGTHGSKVP